MRSWVYNLETSTAAAALNINMTRESMDDVWKRCSILFVPGGNIPRVETKKRECWKFLDWRLNSENDSRLHVQPSWSTARLNLQKAFLLSRAWLQIVPSLSCRPKTMTPTNTSVRRTLSGTTINRGNENSCMTVTRSSLFYSMGRSCVSQRNRF